MRRIINRLSTLADHHRNICIIDLSWLIWVKRAIVAQIVMLIGVLNYLLVLSELWGRLDLDWGVFEGVGEVIAWSIYLLLWNGVSDQHWWAAHSCIVISGLLSRRRLCHNLVRWVHLVLQLLLLRVSFLQLLPKHFSQSILARIKSDGLVLAILEVRWAGHLSLLSLIGSQDALRTLKWSVFLLIGLTLTL